MNDHDRAGPLDRRTAERLLDGADGHARLHALLSAAAGPARPEEFAGEDAAVAAFRAAPRPAQKSRVAVLRRFLTVKALVLVGGSLILTGGAAYATITGRLPGQDPAPSPTPTLHEQGGAGRDSVPVTRSSPTEPHSNPPSATPPTTASMSPSSGTASENPGRSSTPGQQKKPTTPGNNEPPRGPGNNNGSPPGENSGNGNGNGNGNGKGKGKGNGTGKGNGNEAANTNHASPLNENQAPTDRTDLQSQ